MPAYNSKVTPWADTGVARGTKMFVIDGAALLALLTHYSQGDVPVGARLRSIGVSRWFNGWIGLEVESDQWRDEMEAGESGLAPLHIRYEGRKTLSWGDRRKEYEWTGDVEPPKRS